MTGNIHTGLAWAEGHALNRWGYDHAAGASTRFGPAVTGELFPSRSSIPIADCSGLLVRALVEGDMPRYNRGFPESSGDMAIWAERQGPPTLLWSIHGGGVYDSRDAALANCPDGAVATLGDHSNGDAGHVIFIRRGGLLTLESSSGLGGCKVGSVSRYTSGRHQITAIFLAPTDYDTIVAPPPPPPPVWHAWLPLGGILTSTPTVCSWAPGRIDLFARGTNHDIWTLWYDRKWNGWADLGGPPNGIASDPAVASWGVGRLDLFVRGNDRHLWHRWYHNKWSGWEDLGGTIDTAPAVTAWGPDRLDVFAMVDGHVGHKWWDGHTWTAGWEDLGGAAIGAPTACAWGPHRLDVFVRGTDNALYHRWYNGTAWSGWENQGGKLTTAPAAASWGPERIDVFAGGTDHALYHRWYDGTWSPAWESLGGFVGSTPAADSWGPERVDVFVRGTDNQLWQRWFA